MFRFKCATCDEYHEGMPAFGALAPEPFYLVPEAERENRCQLMSDLCIIDENQFFVRGRLVIRVLGEDDQFVWLAWVSLGQRSFDEYLAHYEAEKRAHLGPYFGWLVDLLQPYPDSYGLKLHLHPLDEGMRPLIELEPSEHQLALEQRNGITPARAAEIVAICMHGGDAAHG